MEIQEKTWRHKKKIVFFLEAKAGVYARDKAFVYAITHFAESLISVGTQTARGSICFQCLKIQETYFLRFSLPPSITCEKRRTRSAVVFSRKRHVRPAVHPYVSWSLRRLVPLSACQKQLVTMCPTLQSIISQPYRALCDVQYFSQTILLLE